MREQLLQFRYGNSTQFNAAANDWDIAEPGFITDNRQLIIPYESGNKTGIGFSYFSQSIGQEGGASYELSASTGLRICEILLPSGHWETRITFSTYYTDGPSKLSLYSASGANISSNVGELRGFITIVDNNYMLPAKVDIGISSPTYFSSSPITGDGTEDVELQVNGVIFVNGDSLIRLDVSGGFVGTYLEAASVSFSHLQPYVV